MKVFIALFAVAMASAAQASYLPAVDSAWSHSGLGWNSWNDWDDWNGNHIAAYPYAKSWSSAWPAASLYNGWDGQYGLGLNKVNSWGLPWGTYGADHGAYGWGHPGLVKTVVPVAKQIAATPGSLHIAPVPLGPEKVVAH
ncbi:uncharacterized protein LOC128740909 [Sabethes cyaneus]|uniref:uncharacterized protein LOC128740909 n=1 Tax=Sabethes cyaneus TaxID=53552 RepID=UPI00237E09CC|nr:uncharacterized protein LOC128740909 [Sabethes cyaneus]